MWSLIISLLLSAGVFNPAAESAHDFHVSRLTANYKPDQHRIECTLITFVDDLESMLALHHNLPKVSDSTGTLSQEILDLTEPGEHPKVDSLLTEYLRETIQVSLASGPTPLSINYIGKERDEDPYGMFIYFYLDDEALSPKGENSVSERLELKSSFMLELYEDQQNVVVWELNGESSDYDLLTYRTRTCDFER